MQEQAEIPHNALILEAPATADPDLKIAIVLSPKALGHLRAAREAEPQACIGPLNHRVPDLSKSWVHVCPRARYESPIVSPRRNAASSLSAFRE